MIDELLRNNLIIREWLNGGLLPLNLSLVLVIGLFLWDTWREPHAGKFQDVAGVQTACALLWIFASDAMRAGIVWWILATGSAKAQSIEAITAGMVLINVGFLLAGVIGIAASMRCIYLFTPDDRKHVYWTRSMIITLTFQVVSHLV